VAELAHRINGLAAYAGQPELRSTALGIERAVREGDLPRLRDALDRLSALAVDLRPGD
jgi:HPt (histidine-containing phosphotransfer) domain-containing protein